jgi:ABC-type uncharacterized transport system permease subunit
MESIALLIAASIASGTALAVAALGLLVSERSGVLNLGAEGMMLVAAVTGFATAVHTHSTLLALLAGAASGILLSAVFGVLVIWLHTNQYATGLALSLFGSGFSAFVGLRYVGESLGERTTTTLPLLADIPFLGPAIFRQQPFVYFAVLATAAIAWFLFKTKGGLVLRSIGESPESAHVLGYAVRKLRLCAACFGGAMAGLAGAYVSVIHTPLWVEGMIAGKGWIALSLTAFATWRPLRVLLGAYLFGGVTMLQLHLQGEGVDIPVQLLTMLPYVATIVVLVIISRNPTWIRTNMPASLGKPFTA